MTGLHTAVYDSYAAKSSRQRSKREVAEVMADVNGFCRKKRQELHSGTYQVGDYRHFKLRDKKKQRDISVLPYEDRCIQNDIKDAIESLILRQMTDDMMGGLPRCGVLASDKRHQVVARMRVLMNNRSLIYYLQGDISKFYDHVDNVISMELIERHVKDKRTLAVVRQHLFNQKKLAIGDPFSHLIANLNMSVIIRKAKKKYGKHIKLVNFADDFIAFSKDKETLANLRHDMRLWARQMRLHYKPMYVRKVETERKITFCGYVFNRGVVKPSNRTKKRYIKSRHSSKSMGSYKGIMQVADTKHLRKLIERLDNRHMAEKIRRPFAGAKKKVEMLEGIPHTIVAVEEKKSWKDGSGNYMHVQAIADSLGLIVYTTSSRQMCKYLRENTVPMRDMKIVHDYSGYYYEGTVYTDAEEEVMIREQFNIF